MHIATLATQAATEWIARLSDLHLPVKHLLVTVTLPVTLRRIAHSYQKFICGLLMETATIQKLARDPQWVGGEVWVSVACNKPSRGQAPETGHGLPRARPVHPLGHASYGIHRPGWFCQNKTTWRIFIFGVVLNDLTIENGFLNCMPFN